MASNEEQLAAADDELERASVMGNDEDPLEALAQIRLEEERESLKPEEGEVQEEEEEEPEQETSEEPENTPATDDLEVFEDKEPTAEDETSQEAEPADENENQGEDDEPEEKEELAPQLQKFRANGQDFEFTQEEINAQFGTVFGKAMDYTHKMQKIAPFRKMVSALEEENISEQDLNLAIDALKGNKSAIQKIVAQNSIDIYDLNNEDEDNTYKATDYGKTASQIALQEVDRQISADPEYPQTIDVISNQWDDSSKEALADNPEWIAGLHSDIKSGVFSRVSPEATKLKMMDQGRKPDIEYYLLAGQQLLDNAEQAPVVDPVEQSSKQFKTASAEASKKRSASSTRSRGTTKKVTDYLDSDNDEEFDEWYDNIIKNN